MRVCGCVWVCVRVMRVEQGEIGVQDGTVVETTAAHRQVVGSSPTRKVYTPFLVASHTFLCTVSPSFLPREPLVPSGHRLIARIHIHTHTHTHLHAFTSTLHTDNPTFHPYDAATA